MVKLHRVSVIESYLFESKDLTLEAKKDLEDLKDYLGDDLFDSYMKIRDRIPKDKNDFKDFSKLKKMDKKDIQDFVSSFQSKSDKKKKDKQEGAEKIYEDDSWTVYRITTYPAAQLYGKGTKWCITGRYPGHEERGQEYFNNYIRDNNLDGGYYFYISKEDPDDKYCLLQTKDGKIHSVWEMTDTDLGNTGWTIPSSFPKVQGISIDPKPFKALSRSLNNAISERNYADVRDIVKQMKKYNVSLDETGKDSHPLIRAVNQNLQKIASYLISSGADVNVKDDEGCTPIYYVKSLPMLEMLLENGADVNVKYKDYDLCTYGLRKNLSNKDFKDAMFLIYNRMNDDNKLSYIKNNISVLDLDEMLAKGIISKEDYIKFVIEWNGYDKADTLSQFEPDALIAGITRLSPKDKKKAKEIALKYIETHPNLSHKKVTKDNIDTVSIDTLLNFLLDTCWSDADDQGEGDVFNFLYGDLITDSYAQQYGRNLASNMYKNKEGFHYNIDDRTEEAILKSLERGGIGMDKLIKWYGDYYS